MTELEPEVLEAASNATRYEFESERCTIIVELVDDVSDEWVVRTAGGSHLTSEKELVTGRAAALRRARVISVTASTDLPGVMEVLVLVPDTVDPGATVPLEVLVDDAPAQPGLKISVE